MINGFRRNAAAAVTVLALAGGGAAWAASSASAAPAGPAAISKCAASNLAAWVNADSEDGAAGTIYYRLDLTNTGRVTCYLAGFPGVSATGPGGGQLGQAARRVTGTPYGVIDVAPGGTAHSVLGYVDAVLSPACKPKTATFLKVFAPGDTVAKHAFFSLPVCTKGQADLVIERLQGGA